MKLASTFFSCSWSSSCMRNLSTTRRMTSCVSGAKEMVASSRLRNSGVNMRLMSCSSSPWWALGANPMDELRQRLRAGVGGHDQHDIAEVRLATVVVGERAVIHHLQQDVEDIRMRLLDFVEQQHRVRMLGDRLGQQAALIEADISGRRADQTRHGVTLHVFGHVEADQLHAHGIGELPRHLGLADAGGAGEQEAAGRLLRIAQTAARHLDRRGQRIDGLVLTEHHGFQVAVQVLQLAAIVGRHVVRRNARDLGDDVLDLVLGDDAPLLRLRQDALRRAGFVDHVDGFVRQMAVVDVARRQARRLRSAQRSYSARRGAPRSGSSGRAGSPRSPGRSARPRRSSGSAATARDPSRRCRGTRYRWWRRCT